MSEASRRGSLIDQIEREALDGDIARGLRLCLKLGGESGSSQLREWASSELNGYDGAEIPPYRKLQAPLKTDWSNLARQVTGEQISIFHLPEVVRDSFPEELELGQSLPELIAIVSAPDETLQFAPAMAGDILAMMNRNRRQGTAVHALYWQVHRSAMEGIIETIRTRLIGLVAEIRAGLGPGEDIPSSALAEQAVNVVIRGKGNRVAVSQGGVTSDAAVDETGQGEEAGPGRKLFLAIVGLATIAGAVFAAIQIWG